MKALRLTKEILKEQLETYGVTIEWRNDSFIIHPSDTLISESFMTRLVSICKVFGCTCYVSNDVAGKLYINIF